ncbi:MAG: AmpG family muropeptide MFS transporter [Gammaproteobacteria bacterium]|nr:AmpG family muropeptide MFS transporter [Gammaproteobacteria bacterium]|tara:strand:- start:2796 stop:4148 length:1353 start_codon:yes stop_codon:yes gene_type:complete
MNKVNTESWIDIFYKLNNKKIVVLFFLGFSAGLPLLLVFTTMSAWLRDIDIVRTTIGFFGWVTLFYGLKFAWAPLIDKLKVPILYGLMGRRRSWLIIAQILIAFFLFLLAYVTPQGDNLNIPFIHFSISDMSFSFEKIEISVLVLFAFLTLFVSFFSATQDIIVDAYRIEIAPLDLQGMLTAAYQFGYRIGLLMAGAGALYIADLYSWSISYTVMALLMFVGVFTTLICDEPDSYKEKVAPGEKFIYVAFYEPLKDFFSRYKEAILILFFIGLYRLSDLSMAVMANPFYLDIGFTLSEIATVTKIFGVVMTLFGAFIGGIFVMKYGVMRPLFFGSIMISVTTLFFAAMSIVGNDINLFYTTIALDNFTGGFAGTVFIAYLSSLVNQKYTAFQYALFSSLMLMPGKFLSGFSGYLVDYYDSYTNLFVISALLGIPAVVISYYFLIKVNTND